MYVIIETEVLRELLKKIFNFVHLSCVLVYSRTQYQPMTTHIYRYILFAHGYTHTHTPPLLFLLFLTLLILFLLPVQQYHNKNLKCDNFP